MGLTHMKKTMELLFMLLMVLSLLPGLAMEGDGVLPGPEGASYTYCFPCGGALMAASGDALYIWEPGAEAASRLSYDLPEPDEDETAMVYPFSAGDRLYAIRLVKETDEGEVDYGHTALYELTLNGDTAEGEEIDRLDWDELLIYDGNDQPVALTPFQIIGDGDSAAWLVCGNGESTAVAKLDLEDVSLESDTGLEDIRGLVPCEDGKLLLLQHPLYGEENTILLYDPEEEEAEPLAEFTLDAFSPLTGLAYEAENKTVYVCKEGEVCPLNLETGEIGPGVADMPNANIFDNGSACVLNGVYVLCNDSLASRALHGRPEVTVRLRVNDSMYTGIADTAVQRFNETHDHARVTLTCKSSLQEQMVEALMLQDDTIDIYIMDTSMPTYEAVFDRGFLMPLNDSPVIVDLVGQMYPGIQENITREGSIQVLPVQVDAYSLGVDLKVLDKLGLSPADIPDNWADFLDFLPTLAQPLSDHREVSLFEGTGNINEIRLMLLGLLMNEYNAYNTANGISAPFNAEPLRSLVHRLDALDFEALGYAFVEGEDITDLSFSSGNTECLFSTLAGCTPESYSWLGFSTLKLRLTPEHESCMVVNCAMAGINPYTRHPEEALEFMEALAEALPPAQRAALIPAFNEPLRGARNEARLREQRETVARLEARLEDASPANRPLVLADLDQARQTLAELEETAWEVSPAGLQWYRAHDAHLLPSGTNWLNNEYAQENYQYLMQFCAGKITGEAILAGFDKTSDMMRREGN